MFTAGQVWDVRDYHAADTVHLARFKNTSVTSGSVTQQLACSKVLCRHCSIVACAPREKLRIWTPLNT